VLNVLTGGRYKSVTNEVKNYLLGRYGAAPGQVNEEVKKMAVGDQEVITCRPADSSATNWTNCAAKPKVWPSRTKTC
jgi:pyruvate/oxaloacetate carboxyltransferase